VKKLVKQHNIMRLKILWVMFCIGANSIIADSSNLLSLLNNSTSTASKPTVQPKSLTTLITAQAAPKAKKVFNNNLLLQNFLAQQNNPSYQKALAILNDAELQDSFVQDLQSIELFFLQYSVQVLSKFSTDQKNAEKHQDLTSLFQAMPVAASATHQLSNLVNLIQKQTVLTPDSSKKTFDLFALMQPETSLKPKKVAVKSDLDLLGQKTVSLQTVRVKPKNNLNLLTAE
jgi:hypothetical protein